jgi:DNA-binding transcriptional ArsR family regulator
MPVIDQVLRDIQARLDAPLAEIEKLHGALAALTSSAGESARADRTAPASGAAGASAVKSVGARTRRTPRTSERPASSAAAGASVRTAPGATKTAVLAALGDGSAMTAGKIAAATGLHRATVSTTLSKIASSGAIAKAARGYQLQRESDTTRKPARPRPSVSAVATSPSPQAAEPQAAEPPAAGPGVLRHHCAEHDFSRWVAGVLHNEPLAAEIAAAEGQLSADSPTETVETCAWR